MDSARNAKPPRVPDGATVFTRNRNKTIAAMVLILLLAFTATTELLLHRLMGLGNPVIYDANPFYGYRPLPNRRYTRFHGAKLRFNNLGLRAETDFDDDPNSKILFLGDSVTYGGSRIGNEELFSHVSLTGLTGFVGGNAGVNGWGIENIHGLVVESGFRPARTYVTVIPEGDFYRGLAQCRGQPFYNIKPRFALAELWYFFCTREAAKKHKLWIHYASETQTRRVVQKAAVKLKEMDTLLRREGCRHLILVTPTKRQVMGVDDRDPRVLEMLSQQGLAVQYILDDLRTLDLSDPEKAGLFYDSWHLSKAGHEVWARLIRKELETLVSGR